MYNELNTAMLRKLFLFVALMATTMALPLSSRP